MAHKRFTSPLTIIGVWLLLAFTFLSVGLAVPHKAFAGGIGSGGDGGTDSSSGNWGYTHYGYGWARYSSTGSGPTAGINHGASWTTIKNTCSDSRSVDVYILGTGPGKVNGVWRPGNGKYMGYVYNDNTDTSDFAGALKPWGTGGSVDSGRATKISVNAAKADFDVLGQHGVSTSGYYFDIPPRTRGNVAWFCSDWYNTTVTPVVNRVSSPITRGNPASFTLKRTVVHYTDPQKNTNFRVTYRFNNSGPWLNIPTSVSPVYDAQILLKLTANLNAAPITPVLTFPASFIPASATSICVQMAFVGTPPTHVTYGPADSDCVTINNIVTPWSISGTSQAVKNGTAGAPGTPVHVTVGDVFKFQHRLTNSSTSATVSPTINYAGVNTQSVAVTLAAGTVPGLNVGQSSSLLNSGSHTVVAADVGKTFCQAISFNPTSSVNSGQSQSAAACVIVDAPSVSCTQSLSTNPSRLQPGDVAAYIRLAFPASAAPQTLTYSIPGIVPLTTVAIAAGQGTYDITNVTMPNAAQDYAATWSVSGAVGSCGGTVSVTDMPYFSVYGAGIRAGGDFGGSCNGGGTLASWRNYSGGSNYGAGTQLSAIAMVGIVGFASKDTVPANTNPVVLSFANPAPTNSNDSPKLGGNYGGSYCLVDPKVPTSGVTDLGGAAAFSATGQDGAFKNTGNINLTGSTIAVKQNTALFVTGNVYISGNVTYAGGWASQADVPSFVVVATGNIYIDPSVTNLDGLYVAKTNGAGGGQLYTCANAAGPISSGSLYGCSRQLVIHGSFVAKNMHLLRALGTLKDDASHSNAACHNNGGISSGRPTCGAEVFDFSPEMYLSNPAIRPQGNGALHYDSIITLPPIL